MKCHHHNLVNYTEIEIRVINLKRWLQIFTSIASFRSQFFSSLQTTLLIFLRTRKGKESNIFSYMVITTNLTTHHVVWRSIITTRRWSAAIFLSKSWSRLMMILISQRFDAFYNYSLIERIIENFVVLVIKKKKDVRVNKLIKSNGH